MLIKGFGERRHASANCGIISIVSFCCVIWCNLHFLQNIDTSDKGADRRRVFLARLIVVVVEGLGAIPHNRESSRRVSNCTTFVSDMARWNDAVLQ
jgi:hypothetical protein